MWGIFGIWNNIILYASKGERYYETSYAIHAARNFILLYMCMCARLHLIDVWLAQMAVLYRLVIPSQLSYNQPLRNIAEEKNALFVS